MDQLNILCDIHSNLTSNVDDFIHNFNWSVPVISTRWYPNLPGIITQSHIPLDPRPDELSWNNSTAGTLTFKEDFKFKSPSGTIIRYTKWIWNQHIPLSKLLFMWKLINLKVPTDENLANKGIMLFP